MSSSATQERPNTVKISDAGPSRKKIHIEIPAATVDEKLEDSMGTLVAAAALPGFRPGKAPRALVEKRFGQSVRGEAKNQLVAAAFSKAVEDHKLAVVGDPTSESLAKIDLQPGKALSFELEVEVMPEFEMPAFDGLEILKPAIEVTDEMVQKELTNLCINEGELESRESAEAGDYCTGHAIMKGKDGTEFYNIPGAVIQVPPKDKNGKGMILGVVVDDFTKQIGSPKPGADLTVKVKGPENHEVEGIRNNDLTITFKVDRVDRIVQAAPEKMAELFGVADEKALRDAIRERLSERATVEQQSLMRQQVAKHLVEEIKMDLPQRLTAQQAVRTLERRRMELMYRGVKPAEIEEHMAELRNASAAVAVRDLKLFFVLSKAAEDLKVRVDDAEVNHRIFMMARERGVRPEKLRQELIQTNQVGAVFQQIRDHKTMDAILTKAKTKDVSLDEFNKKFSDKEGDAEAKGAKSKKKS
ncbi:MAG: trigger factor [Phycisphaerales bacterium]|nr:MAG: trigger factor [Phycisphaerales bacterium]